MRSRALVVLSSLVALLLAVPTASAEPEDESVGVGTTTSPSLEATYTGPLRTFTAAPGAVRVAVFGELSGFDPRAIAASLNSDPRINAVPVGRARVAGALVGFDVLVARFADDVPTRGMVVGVREFVSRGGGYVGEYWGAGATLSGSRSVSGLTATFIPNRFLALFAGNAYGGSPDPVDEPIRMTQPHPINAGLPGVLPSTGATEFFVQALQPRDLELETVARYTLQGRRYPAIQAGQVGSSRVALIWFDAGDEPNRPFVRRLLINSAYWAAS